MQGKNKKDIDYSAMCGMYSVCYYRTLCDVIGRERVCEVIGRSQKEGHHYRTTRYYRTYGA